MKWTKIYLVIGFLLTNTQILFGQYSFEQISKEQGLSHNNVECILQDSDGFMWFGTRSGLCRFDGYEIKVYRNTSDTNSISGNRIISLAEDKEGYLWIGTHQNGLNKFDRRINEFVHYESENGIGNQIYCIEVLDDGTVCIGSNGGLSLYNPTENSFTEYTPNNTNSQLNSYLISDVLETRNGQIYIATWENDIQRFDKTTGQFYSIVYNPLERKVLNYRKRIIEDNDGNLWIAAQIHGLCRYNTKTGESKFFYNETNQLNSDILNGDMILSPEGKIWISTDGGGINILDPEKEIFEYITFKNEKAGSLPSNQVYTLYADNNNRIWAGTFDKGVAFYDPLMNKFRNSMLPDDLFSFFKSKSVLSVFQDSRETIWIGTDGSGLHSIDKNHNFKSFYFDENNKNSLSSNVVTCIGEDKSGNILIGTYAGSLCVYHPKRNQFTRFKADSQNNEALHSENVWTLTTDSEGKNWLGLLGNGVDIFNPETGTFKNIGPYSNELIKIGHPNVMAIMEDGDGDIWFGTEGEGIFVFDKQAGKILRIQTNTNSSVVTKGNIKDFFQDSQGEIWIATEGNGVLKYNEGSKILKQYTLDNGLPEMAVLGINEDNAGNIWVSTYNGLAILRKSSDTFTAFFKSDGLASNEFNAEAFIKLNNGSFLVGSVNGIDVFNPWNIVFNQNIPKVHFTRLEILNQEIFPGDTINNRIVLEKDIVFTNEIELIHKDRIFSIEFAALNYTHAKKCQYQYKLEGFNEDWINTTHNRRFVSYSHLDVGNYILKVRASNNDGKWGNNVAELKINVLPPFWKTYWFILIIVLILLGILVLAYYSRMRFIRNKFLKEQATQEKRIMELEKENIESELQKLTYYTVNRNRVLINYKNRLVGLSLKAKESVKNGLQVVIDEIDHEIADDKEWKYIEPRLDKFYNDYISKLRELHPDLSLSEIKIATYVRMNLTSKEISEFMHKTIRAVESDRYRLRKKINLDSNESLQTYLLNL